MNPFDYSVGAASSPGRNWTPLCLAAALVALASLGPVTAPAASAGGANADAAAQALHQLLDAEREWALAQFPEEATRGGDHRYDDRVTDYSPAAAAARHKHHRETLAAVRAIDRSRLQGEDRTSSEVLEFNAESEVRRDENLVAQAAGKDAPWSSSEIGTRELHR